MVTYLHSLGIRGIKGFITDAEVYISRGIPDFRIIGLGDASVREAQKRVEASIKNQGYEFPLGNITVNLAPSGIRKEGTSFDLAIALGILICANIISTEIPSNWAFIGELSLSGNLRPIAGILPMISEGVSSGIDNFVVPKGNEVEASYIKGANIYAAESLRSVEEILKGNIDPCASHSPGKMETESFGYCFSQVRGQHKVKRALEIAAAGNHNILMLGAPGSGKTLMAKCIPGILPPLSESESYEVTSIASACGLVNQEMPFITQRPFREIHPGVTKVALLGGGRPVIPGEITLAHRGVLFLDEMTEISSQINEALRIPIEAGNITVARNGYNETFPAKFMLVGAANPCPCGNLLEGNGKCRCTPLQIRRISDKISKPLLDRIDIQIPVKSLTVQEMFRENISEENSLTVRKRVINVRIIQEERYKEIGRDTLNSTLSRKYFTKMCPISQSGMKLLEDSAKQFGISMRGYDRIVRIARTIADVEGHEQIMDMDIAEAIGYRCFDRVNFNEGVEMDA